MLTVASIAIMLGLTTSPPPAVPARETIQQEPPAAAAPVARSEREEIRGLVKVGQKVAITDDGGRRLEGCIQVLGPDRLRVASQRSVTELEYERIVRIDRPHDGLGNGALVGFSAGAVLGLALVVDEETSECEPGFLSCGDPHPAAYALVPGIIGGLGAAIGVGVDALIRRDPGIYRRGSGAVVRVIPTVGRGAAGATVQVRW